MAGISETISNLQSLCNGVRQIRPQILEAMTTLEHALVSLRGLDTTHARNAELDIRAALADLREAHAIWIDDYIRRAEDLCRRLAA